MSRSTLSLHYLVIAGARTLYWVGGSIIILIAAVSLFTQMSVIEILEAVNKHFGKTFSTLYSLLLITGIFALAKLRQSDFVQKSYWAELGFQAANGISTIALTFTLFGISMGIGALSNQSLSPENVESVIASLTTQFSIAFMTTVVGLPTAALLRAVVSLQQTKYNAIKECKHAR